MSAADKIAEARALIGPLRATVLWGNTNPDVMKAAEAITALADLADALAQENARLRAALRPFSDAAAIKLCGEWQDYQSISRTDTAYYITFGHLRSARAALGETP